MTSPTAPTTGDAPSRARLAIFGAKFVISAGLLTFLLTRIDTSRFLAIIQNVSLPWLTGALGLYLVMILASVWRWQQLLEAQHLIVPRRALLGSYLVATFFSNFLPSNIGGDVMRIRDTADAAGSRTLATTVVAMDRAIGLVGLLFVAAAGASAAVWSDASAAVPVWPPLLWGAFAASAGGLIVAVGAPTLAARTLAPARRFHATWVEVRLGRLTAAFSRFRERPALLVWCLGGAVVVQAVLVAFYAVVAHSAGISIAVHHLAVLVPVSFVVQMVPVSINGFGVREATFSYYFSTLGLPIDAALALSLLATFTVVIFSLSGLIVYATRR